ncbi:MAG: prefoldin beta subunit [Methanosarcinales archaeon]|uniref:prefoldin subunit beta n=1 Tax=Methermicoccus shengliensis TaxID=660064 RepID=UPI0005B2C40D|nr:prefoldin subunit beta [Methermicoccus shengliensis]MDI3488514.1 prefoldin beta subunit [Methanosarcinales archaeon]MDN5295111.1 prefoldin beta subunit [Methanosarcinales archaeon]
MASELPPQVQNQIAQLQQVQQQAQALSSQKAQVELMLREVEAALEELSKLPEDAVVYKSAGELLLRVDKPTSESELKERKETLELRIKTIDRQLERVEKRFKELQEQIKRALGSKRPVAE